MAKDVRGIIISDLHAPLHFDPAVKCVLGAIDVVKPQIVICLGDIGEHEGSSPWRKKKEAMPPLAGRVAWIDKDIADCNAMLDRIDKHCDEAEVRTKHFIQGNHDLWMDNVVEYSPILQRTTHEYGQGYMFGDSMRFKRRGWKYLHNTELLKIGHLRFTHGNLYGREWHTKNYLMRMGCNILYAHYHDCQQTSITQVGGEISAWSIGCLKSLLPEDNQFMRGKPSNWCHAFAVVDWWGKNFSVTVHRIIEGRAIVDGVKIDGNAV